MQRLLNQLLAQAVAADHEAHHRDSRTIETPTVWGSLLLQVLLQKLHGTLTGDDAGRESTLSRDVQVPDDDVA